MTDGTKPERNPDPEVAMNGDQVVVTFYDDYFEAKPFWGYCDVYLSREEAEKLIAQMQAAMNERPAPESAQ